jgi:hypothetical protein
MAEPGQKISSRRAYNAERLQVWLNTARGRFRLGAARYQMLEGHHSGRRNKRAYIGVRTLADVFGTFTAAAVLHLVRARGRRLDP